MKRSEKYTGAAAVRALAKAGLPVDRVEERVRAALDGETSFQEAFDIPAWPNGEADAIGGADAIREAADAPDEAAEAGAVADGPAETEASY